MRENGATTNGVRTPTYNSWRAMRARCEDTKNNMFSRYGGIGVSYPAEWKDFRSFLRDMGERPQGTSLDRVDNLQGYSKENCRWATLKEQARNKSNGKLVLYRGIVKQMVVWVEELRLNYDLVKDRINRGWSAERAFNERSFIGKNQSYGQNR